MAIQVTTTVKKNKPTQLSSQTQLTEVQSYFSKENYKISSWNTEKDGSGTSYAVDSNIKISADQTIYAQWKRFSLDLKSVDGSDNFFDSEVAPIAGILRYRGSAYPYVVQEPYASNSNLSDYLSVAEVIDEYGQISVVENHCFDGCENLKSVNLPGVRLAKDFAFFESGLTSINLPNLSATTQGMINNCANLISASFDNALYIDNSFEYFGGYYFLGGCINLKHLSMPNLIEFTYSNSDINDCLNLETIQMQKISAIYGTISQCPKLSCIYVNNEVLHSIGDGYDFEHSLVVNAEEKIAYACAGGVKAISNDTIEIIVDCGGNHNLKFVNLPNATSISSGTFSDCTSLSSVNLPNATSIGWHAFSNCTSLSSVNLPEATSIREYAFSDCTSLSSISLPNATSIGSWAFYYCTRLSSVNLSSVTTPTSLGSNVFKRCPHISVYVKNDELVEKFSNADAWKDLLASNQVEFIVVK